MRYVYIRNEDIMKSKGEKIRLRGGLGMYLRWPFLMDAMMAVLTAQEFMHSKKSGCICLVYLGLFLLITLLIYFLSRRTIYNDLVEFAQNYGEMQAGILNEMHIPMGVLSETGHLIWCNKECQEVIVSRKAARKNISNIFPDITEDVFPRGGRDRFFDEELNGRNYQVALRRVSMRGVKDEKNDSTLPLDRLIGVDSAIIMIIGDTTEANMMKKQVKDENLIVGLLYIDNYEEIFNNSEDVKETLSLAICERRINTFMNSIDAVSKKFEKDKYLFVFRQKNLEELRARRFPVVEEIRSGFNNNEQIHCTISIGIGTGTGTFTDRYMKARGAIDLALGRGGDQVVIKNNESEEFFGGKSVQVERTTRVKARVKAQALQDLITGKERVVVMGHQKGDLDSFGACTGIYRIAKALDRKAYIVFEDYSKSVDPILSSFSDIKYPKDMIIDCEQAKNLVDEQTALIIVDTSTPERVQCPELLGMTKSIVVIDHHRQAGNSISNALLRYIEPYASSACEMVAEITQYVSGRVKLTVEEANAMYAGIMIDTNHFTDKTGIRTLETMAYLKRSGADTVKVRKMFREDIGEYRQISSIIMNTEMYRDGYAIVVNDPGDNEDPMVLAAKVANALLDINNVKASFVLTVNGDRTWISARSIDEVNVQRIMEEMGGGGHVNAAGVQLKETDTDIVIDKLKKLIDMSIRDDEIAGENAKAG
jgi:c-di-AMP phosphodiesterase-like protein